MLLQDIECRIAHRAMAMTPDFIKECFFVPDQFHHPPHIRILFITSEKFQFPVACNENQRRSILANMKQRSKFINSRLKIIYAIHLPIRKMTNHLPAERYQSGNRISIYIIFFQPSFIQTDHSRQIAACRMAGYKYLILITPIFSTSRKAHATEAAASSRHSEIATFGSRR